MRDLAGRDYQCLPWNRRSVNVEIWNLKIGMINMHFIGYKNRLISSCTGSEKCEYSCSRGGCLRQAKLCSFSNMPVSNTLFFFFFFFNGFYFFLHCLNHLNRRAPLWGSLRWNRMLPLGSLLCTDPQPCLLPLNLCLCPKRPWAPSTPAHMHGTGFSLFPALKKGIIYIVGGVISTAAQILLIAGSSSHLLYIMEKVFF